MRQSEMNALLSELRSETKPDGNLHGPDMLQLGSVFLNKFESLPNLCGEPSLLDRAIRCFQLAYAAGEPVGKRGRPNVFLIYRTLFNLLYELRIWVTETCGVLVTFSPVLLTFSPILLSSRLSAAHRLFLSNYMCFNRSFFACRARFSFGSSGSAFSRQSDVSC